MCKEYEVKIKMVQEQWLQLEMKLGYNMNVFIKWGDKNLLGDGVWGDTSRLGEMSKFLATEGNPPIPQSRKSCI